MPVLMNWSATDNARYTNPLHWLRISSAPTSFHLHGPLQQSRRSRGNSNRDWRWQKQQKSISGRWCPARSMAMRAASTPLVVVVVSIQPVGIAAFLIPVRSWIHSSDVSMRISVWSSLVYTFFGKEHKTDPAILLRCMQSLVLRRQFTKLPIMQLFRCNQTGVM